MMGNALLKSNRQSQMMGPKRLLVADAVKRPRDKQRRSEKVPKNVKTLTGTEPALSPLYEKVGIRLNLYFA